MKNKKLLEQYLSLNLEIISKGVRTLISGNDELEFIYEKVLRLEDEILQSYSLPLLMQYREIILSLTEQDKIEHTIELLKNAASEYLNSTPKNNIKLLENAKANDLRTYEVLPELGLVYSDYYYSIFFYEEIFKKGNESAENTFSILKSLTEETMDELNQLKFHYKEYKRLFDLLNNKGLKSLDKYLEFELEYPY